MYNNVNLIIVYLLYCNCKFIKNFEIFYFKYWNLCNKVVIMNEYR